MTSIDLNKAGFQLDTLVEQVTHSREPVQITSQHGNAVLVAAADWSAVQETLHLLSIPGMRETLVEGLNTPLEECSEDPGW